MGRTLRSSRQGPDALQSRLDKLQHALTPVALEPLGLTRREAEVLLWVAQGKTNKVVGTILGLSARTVQKHLERIYEKLGVETRTAASIRALDFQGILSRRLQGTRARRVNKGPP